ncbi:hypothetical protein G3I40_28125, partial [Streptomyces sp. SID14478]|nr:hypothetical protein [Streptomyces sp. SID14478]
LAARALAGTAGDGTAGTAVCLAAGTLAMAVGFLGLARLLGIAELRRLPFA